MLGISPWTDAGGSYHTVQRFFSTVLLSATLLWVFFRQYLRCPACGSLGEVIRETACTPS
jgi:hypothetical protein